VEEVRQLDDTHLHWVAEFGGSRHEWDAEITEQELTSASCGATPSGRTTPGRDLPPVSTTLARA
jgi:hypothetical protein